MYDLDCFVFGKIMSHIIKCFHLIACLVISWLLKEFLSMCTKHLLILKSCLDLEACELPLCGRCVMACFTIKWFDDLEV